MKKPEENNPFKILVVEDDEEQLYVIRKILTDEGFSVHGVIKGYDAINYIMEFPNALMLLDYALPDINGLQVIESLLQLHNQVDFITMTAYGNEHVAVEMMKLGARDYLVKDHNFLKFLPRVVENTVNEILTERRLKEYQEAYREAQERYYDLFENSQDAVYFTSIEGEILAFNQSMVKLFAYNEEELRNLNSRKLYKNPEDRKIFHELIMKQGWVKNFETELLDKNGDTLHVNLTTTLRKSKTGKVVGYNGIIHDLTDRKIAEQKLSESEKRYRNLFEHIPIGVYRTTPEGTILDANPALLSILGCPDVNALINHKGSDFYLEPHERRKWMELIQLKGVISFETRLKTFDGRIIWVNDNARALTDENGDIIYYEGVMADVTERRETEERLQELINNLRESKQTIEKNAEEILDLNYELLVSEAQLKDINDSKDKFISIIAHDLSTPFNGFIGLSRMLADDAPQLSHEEIREMAEALYISAQNSHKLLEDLLEWGKLQKGIYEISIDRVNVYDSVRLNTDIYASIADEKKIEIINNVPPKLHFRTDKNIMNTVLRNLITNALKYTPTGGKITIDVDMRQDGLELRVADTGLGIDPEMLHNLFEIYRPKPKSGAKFKGSGLGLILCRELLQKISSSIRAESAPGEGTRFYVMLSGPDKIKI